MSTYAVTDLSRREILWCSATLASFGTMCLVAPALGQEPLRRTPDQVLGPFYPITEAFPETADLTKLAGRKGRAEGQVLYVTGRVVNLKGEPVATQKSNFGKLTRTADTHIRAIPILLRWTRISMATRCCQLIQKGDIGSRRSSLERILEAAALGHRTSTFKFPANRIGSSPRCISRTSRTTIPIVSCKRPAERSF